MRARTALGIVLFAAASSIGACRSGPPIADQVITTDFVAQIEWRTESCRRESTTLRCVVVVTNRAADANLVFADTDVSAAMDGAALTLTSMTFGGRPLVAVNTRLPNGAAQRAEFVFSGAPTTARTLRLLEVKASVLDRAGNATAGNEAARAVQIRNVELR